MYMGRELGLSVTVCAALLMLSLCPWAKDSLVCVSVRVTRVRERLQCVAANGGVYKCERS